MKESQTLRVIDHVQEEYGTGGAEDYFIRLCMVVDWYINHPEYTAKIKVIS